MGKTMHLVDCFRDLAADTKYPYIDPAVYYTAAGTPYLTQPGVALVSKPDANFNLAPFLFGYDPNNQFAKAIQENKLDHTTPPAELLCKTAGQLCYMSFGSKRTTNEHIREYLQHILDSGHGSIFEHVNFTLLFWGISRSLTHELVRHRIGVAYSQVSQRYVDGSVLRFVERPEYQASQELHAAFVESIDHARKVYEQDAVALAEVWEQEPTRREWFQALSRVERRKAINQVARAKLPNETEAPILVTGNGRFWRHFLKMRASKAAEPEIRRLAVTAWEVLRHPKVAPILFHLGITPITLPDNTEALEVVDV